MFHCVGGLTAWPVDGSSNKDVGRSERKTPIPRAADMHNDRERKEKKDEERRRTNKTNKSELTLEAAQPKKVSAKTQTTSVVFGRFGPSEPVPAF